MQLDLLDKVVLVTGGTKGIGRAIVEAFLSENARVFFCSRTEEDVLGATRYLKALDGRTERRVRGAVVDVSKKEQVNSWVHSIIEEEGKIDVIVSNVSSISISNTVESWTTAFQVDILGTVTLVEACLPHLEKSHGNIITISSVSGRDVDFTAPSPYGAFKAALVHYMAQLAHTLAPRGVRANTVSPGNIYVDDGVWGGIKHDNPQLFESQLQKNPMGRMGKAEEVANAVVFLASSKAAFISSANLVVDGALCTGVQL